MRRLLIACAMALTGLAGCTSATPSEDGPQVIEPAPTPGDIDTTLTPCPAQDGPEVTAADALPPLSFDCIGGGSLDLSRAPGVPTVVNLWGSWCGPCREELPFIQQLADEAGDQLQVRGVVSMDGLDSANSFAADTGLTFPSGFDMQGDLMTELGLNVLPFTYFIAADGTLTYTKVGPVASVEELEQLVAEHLGVIL